MKIDHSLGLTRRDRLPDALRVLADAYPRADWSAHGNFGEMIRFWMERHAMFRQLIAVMREDVQRYLNRDMGFEIYAPRLSKYGGILLDQLHGHHQIEDAHYFPKLITLDPRLEQGFGLLEADHEAMDGLLNGMATGANAVLRAGDQRESAAEFAKRLEEFGRLLERHLTDEEDIVVPVVLATGFRG